MNRQDDIPDDAELAPYLEGKDGVSAAYRTHSTETPPAALDAAILRAARASLQSPAPEPSRAPALRNYYSAAASLVLGVMLGVILFRDEAEMPDASLASEPQASDLEKIVVVESDTAVPVAAQSVAAGAPATADANASPAQTAGSSAFRERTLTPPPPPVATRNVTTPNTSPFRSETSAAARVDRMESNSIESLVFNLSYRDDPSEWLEEIARLDEKLEEATDDLVEATEFLEEAAEEVVEASEDHDLLRRTLELERAEFRFEHPDVNLDQALSALEGQ